MTGVNGRMRHHGRNEGRTGLARSAVLKRSGQWGRFRWPSGAGIMLAMGIPCVWTILSNAHGVGDAAAGGALAGMLLGFAFSRAWCEARRRPGRRRLGLPPGTIFQFVWTVTGGMLGYHLARWVYLSGILWAR